MKNVPIKPIKLKHLPPESSKDLRIHSFISKKLIPKLEPSPSTLTLSQPSPKNPKLKPIQTVANLSLKPPKSTGSSPKKQKNPQLSLLNPIQSPTSSIKIEKTGLKLSKRRTQSMNSDQLPAPTANFVTRCLYKTRIGSIYGKNKKENQDSFIIHNNLLNTSNNYIFAVCDGHGANGHKVSRHLKQTFPSTFDSFLSKNRYTDNYIQKSFQSSVRICENSLIESGVDLQYSGSTMVSVMIFNNYLICGNIGDSRAVLGKKKNGWVAEDLSRDHKPELEDESARIKKANGRIMPFIGPTGQPMGPKRVWLRDVEAPGLAMSRSIGDLVASSVGVVSEPEFRERVIEEDDCFVIVASDGLWEFIGSREAVEIVGKMVEMGKEKTVCDELVSQAVKRWSRIDGGVDDITVLVIFLNNY